MSFKERCNKLSKKLSAIDKTKRQILKHPLKKRKHTAKKHQWKQCYKPLGKCNSQVLCWGNVYCTEETPNCLSIKEVKT